MCDLSFLFSELRRLKVVGRADDHTSFSVMYSSRDSLLLRYISTCSVFSVWVIVRRTSRQYYRVTALVSKSGVDYSLQDSFRNYRLTAEFIKNLIRR